jgi:hypothetical protein
MTRAETRARDAVAVAALLTSLACAGGQRAAVAPSSRAPASELSRLDGLMPEKVGPFSRVAREVMRGGGGDMIFRFRDTSAVNLSVIVYPVRRTGDEGVLSSDARVRHEGALFAETLPVMKDRRWIESFQIILQRPDSLIVDQTVIPGFVTAASTRQRGRAYYELQFLHLIRGDYVKVRATVPEPLWPREDLAAFDSSLIRILAHR